MLSPLGAWALVGLLLLKAAGPALASAVAQSRRVALVEVCTVYGVRTLAVDNAGRSPPASQGKRMPAEETGAGAADTCILALLPVLGPPPPLESQRRHASAPEAAQPPGPFSPAPLDASRAWWAGLKQGPPRS